MQIAEDLLSPDDVASQLGFTRRTLERLHGRRQGPPRIRVGRRVYYRAAAVREWLLAHEVVEPRAPWRE